MISLKLQEQQNNPAQALYQTGPHRSLVLKKSILCKRQTKERHCLSLKISKRILGIALLREAAGKLAHTTAASNDWR